MDCFIMIFLIFICVIIILTGLYLAFIREKKNVARNQADLQDGGANIKEGTFNFKFAIGLALIVIGLAGALYTVRYLPGCATPVKPLQTEAEIHFKLDYHNAPDKLVFYQQQPRTKEAMNIIIQDDGYFHFSIDLPASDQQFFALVTPKVETSKQSDSANKDHFEICFKIKKYNLEEDKCIARMKCDTTGKFALERGDHGWVELCRVDLPLTNNLFTLFPGAYAQKYSKQNPVKGWTVPNLKTLQEKNDIGYTRIKITGQSLPPAFKDANKFSYSITVNGEPIFIDGLLPKYLLKDFKYHDGFLLEFGLENLNFSGTKDGFEAIDVRLIFYQNEKVLSELTLSFDYIALRSSPPTIIPTEDGSRIQWEATNNTPQESENQIITYSSTEISAAKKVKLSIDHRSLNYKNLSVIGILRPPLPPNKNYGVMMGLQLPTKQVKFTFNFADAKEFLTWIREHGYQGFIRKVKGGN